MAILKCKMCGGDLNVAEGMSVCECEYCGTKQTVPMVDDEKKITLFARANRLRFGSEFDKAAGVYEAIVADFPEEAEAYWGLVLCQYGIEYVDDPKTGKKIPTCHRSSFDSVMDDNNFDLTLEYADPTARGVYREEAKRIEELRRNIIAVSSKEEPYDIFICYKETDDKGERTIDSVIAQDVYTALTEKGYRVFFSRISLEDKLGVEYEPYIFAALHSAKVMLAFGTDYEYYNAVWVKNEWSRFLQLIEKGEKKALIPCYKGIDAYDMPKEFAKLQAQDMGKVGAMQDLLRGVEKILGADKTVVKETVVMGGNSQVAPLLKRAFMYLEDGDWAKADSFCEQVLNIDPERAEAYLGKLMAELQVHKREDLKNQKQPFDTQNLYQKVIRFGDEALKRELQDVTQFIQKTAYRYAVNAMNSARTEEDYKVAIDRFEKVKGYKDADSLLAKCIQAADEKRTEAIYDKSVANMKDNTILSLQEAINGFRSIYAWKDSAQLLEKCEKQCKHLKEQREIEKQEQQKGMQRQKKRILIIGMAVAAVIILLILVLPKFIGSQDVSGVLEADPEVSLSIEELRQRREEIAPYQHLISSTSSVSSHTVALKADGTVLAKGENDDGQCNVDGWKDIVAVEAGIYHTAGLKADGTVVSTGSSCPTQDWTDIIAISSTGYHIAGLKADGTVVAVGGNENGQCNVEGWRDIVAVAASRSHTVGLKADGTVVAVGNNESGQCGVGDWTDIVAISAGGAGTVGLKADGTVVVVGSYQDMEMLYTIDCAPETWKNVVAVEAGCSRPIGLKADGTVIGFDNDWTDIVAISARGNLQVVGLKADGTMVAHKFYGEDMYDFWEHGQCDVSDWDLF